ncbi:uncharacterized protein LOC129572818, partial [Sitodiplosis mosellana]|uniref:uncharacterized protein LOC129572818 n=1 Tax=Sitodiplosis mosellana TaxID=263140 RepID=UPI00244504C0
MPDVKIPWRRIPKYILCSEHKFLDKCRVTNFYMDPEDMMIDDDNEAMIKINTIVRRINEVSDKFTTAQKRGKYNNFGSDMSTFEGFAAELLKIDQDLNASGEENHDGPLILAVCRDMYSILSFMATADKLSPAKPSQNQENRVKALLKQGKYLEAKTKITEILKTTPVKSDVVSELLLDRAIANSETRFCREAIEDATNAMKDSRLHSKCLEIRAKCYMSM